MGSFGHSNLCIIRFLHRFPSSDLRVPDPTVPVLLAASSDLCGAPRRPINSSLTTQIDAGVPLPQACCPSSQRAGPTWTHVTSPQPLRHCHVARGNPAGDCSSSSQPMGDGAVGPSFSAIRSESGPHLTTPESRPS